MNQTTSTIEVQEAGTGISWLTYMFVLLGVVLLRWFILKRRRPSRSNIAIVGQRSAGKTQLFISLNNGKRLKSVSSIRNNSTHKTINGRRFIVTDYIGDNISKEEILHALDSVHMLIHVIDGTDAHKIGDAAQFLYRVLLNKKYQRCRCHYVLLLNKEDDPGFLGRDRIIKRLQNEIETIKVSRRNQIEEDDCEEDWLKTQKQRFELPKQITIIAGSGNNNIKELELVLFEAI